PHHIALDPAEPLVLAMFEPALRHKLHADADAEKGFAALAHGLIKHLDHARNPIEPGAAVAEGSNAGQNDAVGIAHAFRLAGDENLRIGPGFARRALERLGRRTQIARAVINDGDAHLALRLWKEADYAVILLLPAARPDRARRRSRRADGSGCRSMPAAEEVPLGFILRAAARDGDGAVAPPGEIPAADVVGLEGQKKLERDRAGRYAFRAESGGLRQRRHKRRHDEKDGKRQPELTEDQPGHGEKQGGPAKALLDEN